MKKVNSCPYLVILLMAALVLSGCMNLGGKEQTVQEFLKDVTVSVQSLQSNRIADLVDFPIVIPEGFYDEETDKWEDLELTRTHFITLTEDVLTIARDEKVNVVLEIEVPDTEDNVTVTDNAATIENAVLNAEIEITQETMEKIIEVFIRSSAEVFKEITGEEISEEDIEDEIDWTLREFRDAVEEDEWIGKWAIEDEEMAPFELVKVNKKWKFAVPTFDFDVFSLGIF